MASVALGLSSNVDANGKSQILVRLTITRTNRPRFRSGVFVRPEWLRDGVLTIPKRGKLNFIEIKEAEEAKAQLDDYVSRLTHISNQLGMDATKDNIEQAMKATKDIATVKITSATIMEAQKAVKKQQKFDGSFLDLFHLYVNRKQYSYDEQKGYMVLMRMMARYELFIRRADPERADFTLDVNTATKEIIEEFRDYIRSESELAKRYPTIFEELLEHYPIEITTKHVFRVITPRGENTVVKMMKRVRTFFRWAYEQGYTDSQPFNGVEIKSETYGVPFYLTMEERNLIADFDFSDKLSLAQQRDIFIFQCLIGCRVGDLLRLTKSNIVDGAVEYTPHKTSSERPQVIRVPLNTRAKAIIERYKDLPGTKLLPFISPQQYNYAIKDVLTACGIDRLVTVRDALTGEAVQKPINTIASSHMARRTFIGNLYQQVQDPNLIGALSGHTEGSRAFVRYRNINEELKKKVVSLID